MSMTYLMWIDLVCYGCSFVICYKCGSFVWCMDMHRFVATASFDGTVLSPLGVLGEICWDGVVYLRRNYIDEVEGGTSCGDRTYMYYPVPKFMLKNCSLIN